VGPDLTHVGSRSQIASGVLDNSTQNLARFIKDPQAIKPGALMPSFQTFSDDDLAALAAYLDGLK
jgi:cytochrome c oxidase subunit 2